MDKAEIDRLLKAAEYGNATAQKNLGLCYYDGEGVPQDYEKAVYWFAKAENQGKDTPLEEAKRHLEAKRAGLIELAVPIAHRSYFKNHPCIIGDLLGISAQDLEKVIYYERYIVINPGNSKFNSNQVISEEYGSIKDKANLIGKGAEAIRKALIGIIPPNELEEMILVVLPINNFDASDLRELYRKVVNLNHRVKRLIEESAPDIILRNEKRALQEAVDEILGILTPSKTQV